MNNQTSSAVVTPDQPQKQVHSEPNIMTRQSGPYDNYALTSFLLGTFSIITSLFVYPGLVFGIISIVFGLRGRQSITKSKLAKIGILLGVIGLLSSSFWGIINLYLSAIETV